MTLPAGHPTVAFNEAQIYYTLRVVAEKGAKASFEMLESLVLRANHLHCSNPPQLDEANRQLLLHSLIRLHFGSMLRSELGEVQWPIKVVTAKN